MKNKKHIRILKTILLIATLVSTVNANGKMKDYLPDEIQINSKGLMTNTRKLSENGYSFDKKDGIITKGNITFKVSNFETNEGSTLSVIEKTNESFDVKNKLRNILSRDFKLTHLFFDSKQELKSAVHCGSQVVYETVSTLRVIDMHKNTQNSSCLIATPKSCRVLSESINKNLSDLNSVTEKSSELNSDLFSRIQSVNKQFSSEISLSDEEIDKLNTEILKTQSGTSLFGKFTGSKFTNRSNQKSMNSGTGFKNALDLLMDSQRLCNQFKNDMSSKYNNSTVQDLILVRKAQEVQTSSGSTQRSKAGTSQ